MSAQREDRFKITSVWADQPMLGVELNSGLHDDWRIVTVFFQPDFTRRAGKQPSRLIRHGMGAQGCLKVVLKGGRAPSIHPFNGKNTLTLNRFKDGPHQRGKIST